MSSWRKRPPSKLLRQCRYQCRKKQKRTRKKHRQPNRACAPSARSDHSEHHLHAGSNSQNAFHRLHAAASKDGNTGFVIRVHFVLLETSIHIIGQRLGERRHPGERRTQTVAVTFVLELARADDIAVIIRILAIHHRVRQTGTQPARAQSPAVTAAEKESLLLVGLAVRNETDRKSVV